MLFENGDNAITQKRRPKVEFDVKNVFFNTMDLFKDLMNVFHILTAHCIISCQLKLKCSSLYAYKIKLLINMCKHPKHCYTLNHLFSFECLTYLSMLIKNKQTWCKIKQNKSTLPLMWSDSFENYVTFPNYRAIVSSLTKYVPTPITRPKLIKHCSSKLSLLMSQSNKSNGKLLYFVR